MGTIAAGDPSGSDGSTLALLHSPRGIEFFPNGSLLVSDSRNHRIMQYD